MEYVDDGTVVINADNIVSITIDPHELIKEFCHANRQILLHKMRSKNRGDHPRRRRKANLPSLQKANGTNSRA
jgi:hypothetical protein